MARRLRLQVGGKVGVVLPTKEEPRWLQDEARFKEAFEAAGYEVQILFSDGDSAKERTNVETLISQGVSVIVICPHDGTAAAAAAQEARDAGVKVISYDRLIRDTEAVDYYVTFDSIAVGEAQAQYLVDKASGTRSTRCTCMLAQRPTTTPSCSSKAPGTCCSPRSLTAPS